MVAANIAIAAGLKRFLVNLGIPEGTAQQKVCKALGDMKTADDATFMAARYDANKDKVLELYAYHGIIKTLRDRMETGRVTADMIRHMADLPQDEFKMVKESMEAQRADERALRGDDLGSLENPKEYFEWVPKLINLLERFKLGPLLRNDVEVETKEAITALNWPSAEMIKTTILRGLQDSAALIVAQGAQGSSHTLTTVLDNLTTVSLKTSFSISASL